MTRDYDYHTWMTGVPTLPTGSAYAVDSQKPTGKELRRIKRRQPIGFVISTVSSSAGKLADSKRLSDVVTQPGPAKKKKKKGKRKRKR